MGRLQVGDRVRLRLGGADIEGIDEIEITAQHKASGLSIEVPKARLSEGAGNTFTLVATDVAGNTKTSAELTITLDTEVPTPMNKGSLDSINKYLQLTQSGNDAVLKISVTGSGDFSFADQTITLTNGWSTGGLNEDLMSLINNRVILA